MNLIQLDVVGFKSFQNRTTFKFENNLIGIVGPNGSGKSNIIDAIRWVLGEQSAKNLRGSSMKDVIFSGTQETKAKNFAEVAVTFLDDNGERKEIKRRLYRNGDSEYYLNDKKTKLKEINDLYLDFGINKESYSIITQGKVEDIISSKAIDRRAIIEEASGVLKYKNRKKETNAKLEKTTDNIKRLYDIFTEIKDRHAELEEQKNKTTLYLDYKKELEEKDILINIYNIKTNGTKLDKIISNKTSLEKERKTLNKKQQEDTKQLEIIKSNLVALDKTYLKYHEEELELVTKRENLQTELRVIEERRTNRNIQSEKLEEDIKYIKTRKNNLEEKLQARKEETTNINKKIKELNNEITNLESNATNSKEQVEQYLEKLKDEYFNLVNEETKLQNNINYTKRKTEEPFIPGHDLTTATLGIAVPSAPIRDFQYYDFNKGNKFINKII